MTPLAFAQATSSTTAPASASGSEGGGGEDSVKYLSGPGIRAFDEQAKLRQACASGYEPQYTDLCVSVNAM